MAFEQPKVYKTNNGDKMVVASGGEVDVESGGSFKLAGTAVAASAAELNRATDVSGRLVAAGATLTITEALHDGKTVLLDTAAGSTITLPAATGSGAKFRFLVTVAPTSNQHRIDVVGNDAFFGTAIMATDDAADLVKAFEAGADADRFDMNGTTKGGTVGDVVELEDMAADKWHINAVLKGTGTEVTPFTTGAVT